jgi:hypothetical protein
VRDDVHRNRKEELHLAAQQVDHRRSAALVRDLRGLDLGDQVE